MSSCNFNRLVKLLDKELDLDNRLDVFDHLDHCDNCRDTVYHILRDRDAGYFIVRPNQSQRPATQ
jgi:anti-sigma factor RsiW